MAEMSKVLAVFIPVSTVSRPARWAWSEDGNELGDPWKCVLLW